MLEAVFQRILILITQFIKMLGYTFTTEADAIIARNQAATYKGLPNPQGDTLYWVNYNHSEIDGFYYIQYVEGLEAVLGTPIDFIMTIPTPI